MPELPEVETVVRCLSPVLRGRRIEGVVVEWPGVLGGVPVEEFRLAVIGQHFESISRRGKYIIARLSGGAALTIHLKMSGQLMIVRPGGASSERFVRVVFSLDDGRELLFADMRKFGRIRLLDADALQTLLASLGPEPLSDEFSVQEFTKKLGRRNTRIKSLLLDQHFVAGLGNIYADESLYLSGIHPLRLAKSLTSEEAHRLYEAIRVVLQSAVANRGTTFNSYRDGFGEEGANQFSLKVYRRHGMPCSKCSATLRRTVVGGRGSHYCPRCQPSFGGESE